MNAITTSAAIDEHVAALRVLLDREHFYSQVTARTEATAIAQDWRPLPCPPPSSLPPPSEWSEVIVRGYANEFATVLVSICPHGSASYDVIPDGTDATGARTVFSAREAIAELRRLFA
ncbi:hypothetical protein AB0F17_61895 [Nonomuraea sp. NPDC026600]|uniref:hypothetical protein n=1 Tax=Nonomuraea sp. NPDC026600 TaxID=3155363 RepID=UPI00340D7698